MTQALNCPRCGWPVRPGQKFCGNCGLGLTRVCPSCGVQAKTENRFCENCGTALSVWADTPSGLFIKQSPPTSTTPLYHQATAQTQERLSTPGRRSGLRVSSVLLMIAAIGIIVSPSLVWFRVDVNLFGMSLPWLVVRGSDLGELAQWMNIVGKTLIARGEYVIALGALILILSLLSLFVTGGRATIAAIVAISAILCLLLGVEPILRFMSEGADLSVLREGIFTLFGSSLLAFIAAFRLP